MTITIEIIKMNTNNVFLVLGRIIKNVSYYILLMCEIVIITSK